MNLYVFICLYIYIYICLYGLYLVVYFYYIYILLYIYYLLTDYFIYYEELDFGTRLRRAGWRAHYVAESTVWHKESVTVGKASPLKTRFQTRNRVLYLRRNARGWRKALSIAALVAVVASVHVVRHALAGRWDHARAVVQGLAWHLAHPSLTPDARLPRRPWPRVDRPAAAPRLLSADTLLEVTR